jgi:hypothetical protein
MQRVQHSHGRLLVGAGVRLNRFPCDALLLISHHASHFGPKTGCFRANAWFLFFARDPGPVTFAFDLHPFEELFV